MSKLQIVSVVNGTTPETEFVDLTANEDLNANSYALIDKTFDHSETSNIHRHYYRLPTLEVKKGEYIRVFTGVGSYGKIKLSTKKDPDKKVEVHQCYLNSNECIWNNDEVDQAHLLKVETIQTFTVKNNKSTNKK